MHTSHTSPSGAGGVGDNSAGQGYTGVAERSDRVANTYRKISSNIRIFCTEFGAGLVNSKGLTAWKSHKKCQKFFLN